MSLQLLFVNYCNNRSGIGGNWLSLIYLHVHDCMTFAAVNFSIDYCYNFTDEWFVAVNLARSGLSLLSVLIGVPVVVLRIWQCYKQSNLIKHTDRLMVYACITTTLYASVESVQFVRILSLDVACSVIAALVEYMSISVLVITTCIGCHLIILIYQTRCLKHPPHNADKYKRHEIIYIFLTVLLPILFVPWPFFYPPPGQSYGYGPSGAFCWITITDEDCKPITSSVVHAVLLYYVWVAVVWPFTLVVIVAIVVTLCLRKAQRVRCSTYVVFSYMVVFFVATLVNSIGGILLWNDTSAIWYLMIQSVTEPFFTMFTTATLLTQLCWSKCHKRSHKKFAFDPDLGRSEESNLICHTEQDNDTSDLKSY